LITDKRHKVKKFLTFLKTFTFKKTKNLKMKLNKHSFLIHIN